MEGLKMKKVKCPKCRRILFRYESSLEKGKITINIDCPDCKSMAIVNLDPELEQNSKEYLGNLDCNDNEILN